MNTSTDHHTKYIHTKAHVLPSVCADGCSFEGAVDAADTLDTDGCSFEGAVDAADTLDTDGCLSEGANGGTGDTLDAVDCCLPAVIQDKY